MALRIRNNLRGEGAKPEKVKTGCSGKHKGLRRGDVIKEAKMKCGNASTDECRGHKKRKRVWRGG